jgi:hypothetical protein
MHWPYGAPLERVGEALSALVGRGERYEEGQPEAPDGWGRMTRKLNHLQWQERVVLTHAEVAPLDLQREKALLEEHSDLMDEEERYMLELFTTLQERASREDFKLGPVDAPCFADLPEERRNELVRESLRALAVEREQLFDSLGSNGGSFNVSVQRDLPRESNDT